MINNLIYTRLMPFLLWKEHFLIRWGATLAAIAASILVGLMAARMPILPTLVLGLVFGVAGVLVLLRWPAIGFPIIVICSLLVPFSIGTGTGTSINSSFLMVVGMVGLWFLEMLTRQKKITFLTSRPLLPLFLFIITTLVSFGFGQLTWFPSRGASIAAQIGGASIFILLPCAFFLAAHRMDERWLKWTVWLFLGLALIYTLLIQINYVPVRRMVFTTFQRAVMDSLFWVWFTALAFSQMFLNKRLPMPVRVVLGLLVILSIYTTLEVKQSWTSGWLPSLLAVGIIVLISRPKLAVVGGLAVGALLLIRSSLASDILMGGDNSYSLLTRVEAWKILFQIIARNPLFGVGPSNYYFYTPFFNILGYNVSFNSHNNYIDILAQYGIAGLIFFLWFAVEVGMLSWKIRSKVPEGFLKAYVDGAIGGLVGTLAAAMLGDWVLPFVYNIGMEGFRAAVLGWIFLGAVVMIEQRIMNKQDNPAPGG